MIRHLSLFLSQLAQSNYKTWVSQESLGRIVSCLGNISFLKTSSFSYPTDNVKTNSRPLRSTALHFDGSRFFSLLSYGKHQLGMRTSTLKG